MTTRRAGVVVLVLGLGAALAGSAWLVIRPATVTGPVRAGYVHDPPYMFAGPDGQPRGLSVDILREAARRAGVVVAWVKVEPPGTADTALGSGLVDLWPGLTILAQRKPAVFFTDPWLETEVYVVVRGGGPIPDATFDGAVGLTPLPVNAFLVRAHLPRARLVEYLDSARLAQALCAGEVRVALLPPSEIAKAAATPGSGCESVALHPQVVPGSRIQLAVAARPAIKVTATRLREEIDGMVADGSVRAIALWYSPYAASEILGVYELLQDRARTRFLTYGLVGMACTLVATLALCWALYRAQRAARLALREREVLETKLRRAHRLEAVGQLAGGVAHDFNNLVMVISGNCELAQMETTGLRPVQEALADIRGAADKAADLVRQLLAFSRKQIVAPRVISLHDELNELQSMVRRLLREDIAVAMDLRAERDHVWMDPGQLSQVLLNLAINAKDAMPDGGVLTIASSTPPVSDANDRAMVLLTVEDTGVGMAPEVQARAFEPFYSTKSPGHGTGLGLATVYGVITQAGGTVDLRSTPGRGTRFVIALPVADGPLDAVPAPRPDAATAPSRVILVVEDQDDVRRVVVTYLVRAGYTVIEARDGREGLDRLLARVSTISLVVSDLVMPVMSGRALLEAARGAGVRVPFLFMSGYSEDELTEDERTRYALLRKPFTPAELLTATAAVLDGPGQAGRSDAGSPAASQPAR